MCAYMSVAVSVVVHVFKQCEHVHTCVCICVYVNRPAWSYHFQVVSQDKRSYQKSVLK